MSINLTIGTAPDNWGVWFPSDPKQTPWERFLDEVVEAGYEWIELGPPGYLPTDIPALKGHLERRGLKVTTGFVMRHFEDADSWPAIEAEATGVCTVLQGLGAKFLLLIDDVYTDLFTGKPLRPGQLDEKQWRTMVDTIQKLGALSRDRFGLQTVFHPHVETHVEYESQIEALIEQTDPALVNICLDTGHHAYRGGDPVSFMKRHYDRITYLHIKSVDQELRSRVDREQIPFAIAVGMDVFCEPSKGMVNFKAFRDVLDQVNYKGWGIVEQDMYPTSFDRPLPVAKRTRQYLREIGLG
jgi:inosose dehydratase